MRLSGRSSIGDYRLSNGETRRTHGVGILDFLFKTRRGDDNGVLIGCVNEGGTCGSANGDGQELNARYCHLYIPYKNE